jgi:CheY-like chemotaxis protein
VERTGDEVVESPKRGINGVESSASARRRKRVAALHPRCRGRTIHPHGRKLRDAGYSVIEAVNGDEALTILNSGATIDLLFTDVSMPGSIDGLGLVAFARASFPNLPVVVTSAHLLPADFVACGTPFLSKPCPIEQTLEMIRGQLMQRK